MNIRTSSLLCIFIYSRILNPQRALNNHNKGKWRVTLLAFFFFFFFFLPLLLTVTPTTTDTKHLLSITIHWVLKANCKK